MSTTPNTATVPCAHCKRTGGPCFRISRHDDKGAVTMEAQVCSLLCLLSWTQQQCIAHGVRLATGVQNAVQRLKQLLRGG